VIQPLRSAFTTSSQISSSILGGEKGIMVCVGKDRGVSDFMQRT
jgi:hypothetical protein